VKTIKFLLAGCDISFVAIAPSDITLEQLLKQADRIKPHWCDCGVRSCNDESKPEIEFGYDSVVKLDNDAPCFILEVTK